MSLWRMYDPEPRGVFPCTQAEAESWNAKSWGIFRTVNSFRSERRIENLVRIRAWAVDMDAGTKAEQAERIKSSPLVPSRVVETKRGFQVYWFAKDGKPEHWNALVLDRLVPFFGADKNARDLARILRMPGYYHCKDPSDRFLVRTVFAWEVSYREVELADVFPPVADERARLAKHREVAAKHQDLAGDDFWERLYNLDCVDALRRISGHGAVNGEAFSFRRTARGTQNIYANGRGTSCWVDASGRIGSLDGGGPTMYQWIAWYGRTPSETVRVLRDVYPELTK